MIADETKGFLIIYAKLASIFGNKTMLLLALTIFTVFSLACGSVNSMTQLSVSLGDAKPRAAWPG